MARILVGYARCSTVAQALTTQWDTLSALGAMPNRSYVEYGLTSTNQARRRALRGNQPNCTPARADPPNMSGQEFITTPTRRGYPLFGSVFATERPGHDTANRTVGEPTGDSNLHRHTGQRLAVWLSRHEKTELNVDALGEATTSYAWRARRLPGLCPRQRLTCHYVA